MRPEKAIFRPSPEHANPRGVCGFFAEVFAALGARARTVEVEIDFSESDVVEPIALNFEKGEPVFSQRSCNSAHAKLGGRWLAEHAVPLTLSQKTTRFLLAPTDGGRVKVRVLRSRSPLESLRIKCAE